MKIVFCALLLCLATSMVVCLTDSELKSIMPNVPKSKAAAYAGYLNSVFSEGGLNNCCKQVSITCDYSGLTIFHHSLPFWLKSVMKVVI